MTVDDCKRRAIRIKGENFYLLLGEKFVMCTVPRENDPQQSDMREIVEDLCGAITALMEEQDEQQHSAGEREADEGL